MAAPPSSPQEKIEALRRQLEEDPDIGETDAERLREFSDRLDDATREMRHEKLLRHGTIMAQELDDGLLTAALDDREATEEIVDWIHETFGNEETNRNFRVTLRVFAKHVGGDGDECPPSVDWVPTNTSGNYDTNPGHQV